MSRQNSASLVHNTHSQLGLPGVEDYVTVDASKLTFNRYSICMDGELQLTTRLNPVSARVTPAVWQRAIR